MVKYEMLFTISLLCFIFGIVSLIIYYSEADFFPNKKIEFTLILIDVLSFCMCILGFIKM